MPTTVLLSEIIDAIGMQFDELPSYLDLETGAVHTVSADLLREVEAAHHEEPNLPAWQKPEQETAKRIVATARFERLPTRYDVHEWEIMREFADSVGIERASEDLLDALHGPGAFRYFKRTLRQHRLESAWFEFRANALRQIAIDWCAEHGIAWR